MYEETKRTYIEKETIVQVQAGPELESDMCFLDDIDADAMKGEKDRLAMDLANLQSNYDQLQKNYGNVKDDNNRFVLCLNMNKPIVLKKNNNRNELRYAWDIGKSLSSCCCSIP